MADLTEKVVKIKVIGVGGAGNNVINRMIASGVSAALSLSQSIPISRTSTSPPAKTRFRSAKS